MNRRERRREGRETEKATVTRPMSIDQISGISMEAEQAGYKRGHHDGMKEGIRIAVTACMAAYTVAMESKGYGEKTVEVIEAANKEVFALLIEKHRITGEYDLDIETVKEYAQRSGVDLSWIR